MSEPIVSFDEKAIGSDLRELARQAVEDALNGLLEKEADDLVSAGRYERTARLEAHRAGHYDRKLVTPSGEVAACLKYIADSEWGVEALSGRDASGGLIMPEGYRGLVESVQTS